MAVGVHDPLAVGRAARGGAELAFVTGRGAAHALLNETISHVPALNAPDYLAYMRHLCSAADIPVIVDGEDGFGDPVATAVGLELAGAAGLTVQDLAEDGRFLDTSTMVEAIQRIRQQSDIVVVGRTDLLGTDIDAALRRLRDYREAGAELVMACLNDNVAETAPGEPLLDRLVDAAGGALVVHTPDTRRLLPVVRLPRGVALVLITAVVFDSALATIDATVRCVLEAAGART